MWIGEQKGMYFPKKKRCIFQKEECIFQKGTLLEDPREGRRMNFQKEEFIFKKGAL